MSVLGLHILFHQKGRRLIDFKGMTVKHELLTISPNDNAGLFEHITIQARDKGFGTWREIISGN